MLKLIKLRECFLVFILGGSNFLAFSPYNLSFIIFISLFTLIIILGTALTAKDFFKFGFLYGLGWFGVGLYWIHISINAFGGMPLIASLSIMFLLICYLSIYPALALLITKFLCEKGEKRFFEDKLFPLVMSSSWCLMELLRTFVFTGFPWLSIGYSQTGSWLSPYAPIVGETGITFIIVLISSSLAQHLFYRVKGKVCSILTIILIVISPLLFHFKGWNLSDEVQQFSLVQGNIKQESRWDEELQGFITKKYLNLTLPFIKDMIIVWPEAAIPLVESRNFEYLNNLDVLAGNNASSIITGILDVNHNKVYNKLIVLGLSSGNNGYRYEVNDYKKHHLVPVGEFVPFENILRDISPLFNLPQSSFSEGDYIQNNLKAKNRELLPLICFEIAFPKQLAASFENSTQFIITVSNDAWFGDSMGPWQHLQMAQMRALEFGRPLIRSANNGITAIIGADGKILGMLPQFEEGVLSMNVNLVDGNTIYSTIGDWPLTIFILLFLFFVFFNKNKLKYY